MKLTQMQERLRAELLRRIQRGTLSVSLLSRQTGFGQSHLSNFLHNRKQLSLKAMDAMLAAQHLSVTDLFADNYNIGKGESSQTSGEVPVTSHSTALFEPHVRPSAVKSMLHLPAGALESIRPRTATPRHTWDRFVAVRISSADALPMEPLVLPEALAVIDRHYNSLVQLRPNRPNLYAVRNGAHLMLRYVEFQASRLLLRPISIGFPLEAIEVETGTSPSEFIAGRVALLINEP